MLAAGHAGVAVVSACVYQYFAPMFYTSNTGLIPSLILLFLAYLGGRIPDWDLFFVPDGADWRTRVKIHRQTTHSIILIAGLTFLAYYNLSESRYVEFALYLCIGLCSHLLADVVTGSIPVFLYGGYPRGIRIGIRNDNLKNLFVSLGQVSASILIPLGIYQFLAYNGALGGLKPLTAYLG